MINPIQGETVLRPPSTPITELQLAEQRWTVGRYTFRADFDSGNLAAVRQGPSPTEFQLWTRRDCQGTEHEKGTRSWFYFGMSGMKAGDFIVLTIMNLNRQGRLYSQDYRPWFWTAHALEWQPLSTKVSYRKEGDDFQLRFSYKAEVAGEAFFAFAIPFSYQDVQALLARLDTAFVQPYMTCTGLANVNISSSGSTAGTDDGLLPDVNLLGASPSSSGDVETTSSCSGPRGSFAGSNSTASTPGCQQQQQRRSSGCDAGPSGRSSATGSNSGYGSGESRIYYRRQQLAQSLEGRRVDLITITDCYGMTEEVEQQLEGVFTGDGMVSPPTHVFRDKKIFFVSSRVHPGETPATHMFNGLLALLLRQDDARSAALRRLFVFKLVPFVNPDGVFHGNYRTDTIGQNLNRFYIGEPDARLQPAVYAIKHYLLHCAQEGLLEYYIDLHAHANKKGVFTYGNALTGEQHVQSLMYSKLVCLNNPNFDFMGCNFTEKNMSRNDKDGTSKEGAGRVALYRDTGLTHLYTIEANYNTARVLNAVAPAAGGHRGRASPAGGRRMPPKFTASVLQGVGRAFATAALDMLSANPWSRLPNTEFRSTDGVRGWVLTALRSSDESRAAHLPAMSDATKESFKGARGMSGASLSSAPTGRGSCAGSVGRRASLGSGNACSNGTGSGPSGPAFGSSVVCSNTSRLPGSAGRAARAGAASATGMHANTSCPVLPLIVGGPVHPAAAAAALPPPPLQLDRGGSAASLQSLTRALAARSHPSVGSLIPKRPSAATSLASTPRASSNTPRQERPTARGSLSAAHGTSSALFVDLPSTTLDPAEAGVEELGSSEDGSEGLADSGSTAPWATPLYLSHIPRPQNFGPVGIKPITMQWGEPGTQEQVLCYGAGTGFAVATFSNQAVVPTASLGQPASFGQRTNKCADGPTGCSTAQEQQKSAQTIKPKTAGMPKRQSQGQF